MIPKRGENTFFAVSSRRAAKSKGGANPIACGGKVLRCRAGTLLELPATGLEMQVGTRVTMAEGLVAHFANVRTIKSPGKVGPG